MQAKKMVIKVILLNTSITVFSQIERNIYLSATQRDIGKAMNKNSSLWWEL